jgi:hypothetical protein
MARGQINQSEGKIDIIATRILVETQQATKALADFDKGVLSAKKNVEKLAVQMLQIRRVTGQSISKLAEDFKKLNGQIGTGKFGKLGVNDKQIENAARLVDLYEKQIKALSQREKLESAAAAKQKQNIIPQFVQSKYGDINAYIAQSSNQVKAWEGVVVASAKKAGVSFEAAGAQLKKMVSGTSVAPLNEALRRLGEQGKSTFQKLVEGGYAMRVAFGMIVAQLVGAGINAIQRFFSEAIKQAREYEATLYRIRNAERLLSQAGIEVSVKQLKEGIKDIQKSLPIFSEEDIAKQVGAIAISTKEIGYSGEEILRLAAAIAILNINSAQNEDIMQTSSRVVNSLLAAQGKSLGDLGLSFAKATIEAKAHEMGILKVGDAYEKLTEQEKRKVKLQIVLDTAGIGKIPVEELDKLRQYLPELNQYLETNDARIQANEAAWKDLGKTFGEIFLPFYPMLTNLYKLLETVFHGIKVGAIESLTMVSALANVGGMVISGKIKNAKDFAREFKESVEEARTSITNMFFKDVPENAPDWFMRGWGNRIKAEAETATNAVKSFYDETEDNEDALNALDDLKKKMEDIVLDARRDREDLELKLKQKQSDLDLEYKRKAEDAERNHKQKLEDINRDALREIEDAKRKAREDEKKAEEDLLRRLKELRQRFLLDLEDALRQRDARQVLRLIKEYQLEKQKILEKKKLDDQRRKEDLEAELAAIEMRRKRRIEEEKIEYARRLADLNEAKKREQEDLKTWYAREQEDIQRNIQQKLEKLIDGYAQEYGLHADSQKKIYDLLVMYFGKDMALVNALAQYMANRFAEMQAIASRPIFTSVPPGISGGLNLAGLNYYNPTGVGTNWMSGGLAKYRSAGGFAEGGTVIAKKPTIALFGEKSPEIAHFRPLNGGGADVNKVFGDISGLASGAGGAGGNIGLKIMLAEGLIAEIVENSVEQVAITVERARRNK